MKGKTALHLAAEKGSTELVMKLVDLGADMHAKDYVSVRSVPACVALYLPKYGDCCKHEAGTSARVERVVED